jgi:gas vesicle protein
MRKQGEFWKGTLVGAAIGSALGILFAPKSGKETREDIKRGAMNMKQDLDRMMRELSQDLGNRIDNLKDVAKDLQGEAKEQSQELIRRAEVLKKDLRDSAANLAKSGGEVKDSTLTDARRLIDEGTAVMSELERVTRRMVSSTKEKIKNSGGGAS